MAASEFFRVQTLGTSVILSIHDIHAILKQPDGTAIIFLKTELFVPQPIGLGFNRVQTTSTFDDVVAKLNGKVDDIGAGILTNGERG